MELELTGENRHRLALAVLLVAVAARLAFRQATPPRLAIDGRPVAAADPLRLREHLDRRIEVR